MAPQRDHANRNVRTEGQGPHRRCELNAKRRLVDEPRDLRVCRKHKTAALWVWTIAEGRAWREIERHDRVGGIGIYHGDACVNGPVIGCIAAASENRP